MNLKHEITCSAFIIFIIFIDMYVGKFYSSWSLTAVYCAYMGCRRIADNIWLLAHDNNNNTLPQPQLQSNLEKIWIQLSAGIQVLGAGNWQKNQY